MFTAERKAKAIEDQNTNEFSIRSTKKKNMACKRNTIEFDAIYQRENVLSGGLFFFYMTREGKTEKTRKTPKSINIVIKLISMTLSISCINSVLTT